MLTRIALFMVTNLAILFVLNITLSLFGVEDILVQNGSDLNLTGLLIISAVIGMVGAVISLAMSKSMAKRAMKVRLITTSGNNNKNERWLLDTVARQAKNVKIAMPEVGIFPSPQPNAFATGMFRNKALVAVSEGLLQTMEPDEVEAVLGHEISHIANGDMVTLTLIQGVINTFVIFLSRIIGHFVDRAIFKTQRGYGPAYFITSIVAQVILSIIATTIVMWFSRWREFRADAGGANLAGRDKMIAALKRLQSIHTAPDLPKQIAAFAIRGRQCVGLKRFFRSHPPLEERIRVLEQM